MKKILFSAIAASTLLFACKKVDNSKPLMEEIASRGTWFITEIVDSSVDVTVDYVDIAMNFEEADVINAVVINGGTLTGTWKVSDSDEAVEDMSHLRFMINFPSPLLLNQLSHDYEIVARSEFEIKLIHRGAIEAHNTTMTLNRL